MPFNPGDEVQHKSGGPKMVVVEYGEWGMVGEEKGYKCKWWDEKKQDFNERIFAEVELIPYPQPSGPSGPTRSGGGGGGPHGWMAG